MSTLTGTAPRTVDHTQCCCPAALAPLAEYLDTLQGRAELEPLLKHLSALDVCLDDICDAAEFDEATYLRNLICRSEHYELFLLCWKSGQRSPIHNHAGSICGVRVVHGRATETLFETSPCGQIRPTDTRDLLKGQVCVSQDSDTHQVSNLETEGNNLVTIHVYSPPMRNVDSFSLTSPVVEKMAPPAWGFDGAGI